MSSKYRYILWIVVAAHLLIPIGIASPVSIFNYVHVKEAMSISGMNTNQEKAPDIREQKILNTNMGNEEINQSTGADPKSLQQTNTGNQNVMNTSSNSKEGTINNLALEKTGFDIKSVIDYGAYLWIVIVCLLLLWNLMMTLRMKRRLARAVRYRENIYECDNIPTPFVMGLIRPRIYIPFRLGEEEKEYILLHEKYHIRRRDYIVKIIASLITCVYWFHPLIWSSYFLMIRDMEMSCDEYVLQHMSEDIRQKYSRSLLGFATNHRGVAMGLLAFGESNTRRRVKNIMEFKKHGKLGGIIAVFVILCVGAFCLTDAKKSRNDERTTVSQRNVETTTQKSEEETTINDLETLLNENLNALEINKILIKSHPVFSEKLFYWSAWDEIEEKTEGTYQEIKTEEGANGYYKIEKNAQFAYAIPQYEDDISEVWVLEGELNCGLKTGMRVEEISKIDIPLQSYKKGSEPEEEKLHGEKLAKHILHSDYDAVFYYAGDISLEDVNRTMQEIDIDPNHVFVATVRLSVYVKNGKVIGICEYLWS